MWFQSENLLFKLDPWLQVKISFIPDKSKGRYVRNLERHWFYLDIENDVLMTTRYPKNIWKYLKLGQKFTNFIPQKTPHNYQMVTIGWFSTRLFHETSPGPLETQRDNSEVCWYHGTGGVVGKPVAVHFVTSLVVVVGVVGVVVVAAIIIGGGGGATGLLFVVWCLYLLLILFVVPAGWVRKEWSPY